MIAWNLGWKQLDVEEYENQFNFYTEPCALKPRG